VLLVPELLIPFRIKHLMNPIGFNSFRMKSAQNSWCRHEHLL